MSTDKYAGAIQVTLHYLRRKCAYDPLLPLYNFYGIIKFLQSAKLT